MGDLTKGHLGKSMLKFALPMMLGNVFQQLYQIVDSIIVGKFIGSDALAAVGASYTLMVFLTSVILGLCMGSGVVFSYYFGADDREKLRLSFSSSFLFIGIVTVCVNAAAIIFLNPILKLLMIPDDIFNDTKIYTLTILGGMVFSFLYNYFASVLRSLGNSKVPLYTLIIAAVLNIVLDVVFIVPLKMGVFGAAFATIIAQCVSAVLTGIYCFKKVENIKTAFLHLKIDKSIFSEIAQNSVLASVQQSIMNFGILMVQGLINSFGVTVMAGFAAAVKIDGFAYLPVQDLGNAFSTFIAQNNGAGEYDRIRKGIRWTVIFDTLFCAVISICVVIFAPQLMTIFVDASDTAVIEVGASYLRVVSVFYCFIGYLFMLYGLYRGLAKTQMSIVLTVISLGLRVVLAYTLAPVIGLSAVWWAIPIGWFCADLFGFAFWIKNSKKLTN